MQELFFHTAAYKAGDMAVCAGISYEFGRLEKMAREIIAKRPYRHFKGKLYYVHHIVMHTETREWMVSYQALYEPYGMFVRPLDMFAEEIDSNRPDNITNQTYRFELFNGV